MNQLVSPAGLLPDLAEYPAVTPEDVDRFMQLIDEIARFPVCEVDEALRFTMAGVAELVDAENAFWLASNYEPSEKNPFNKVFHGWMPRQIVSLVDDEDRQVLLDKILSHFQDADPDPYSTEQVDKIAVNRVLKRSDSQQAESEAVEWMEKEVFGKGLLADRVTGSCNLTDKSAAYMGFDRIKNKVSFSERDKELVRVACLGLKWFFNHLHRTYGLIGSTAPLTPREREALLLLLTDRSEKVMADELRLSPKTLHHHVSAVYQKLQVRSRSGLMALWLNYGASR